MKMNTPWKSQPRIFNFANKIPNQFYFQSVLAHSGHRVTGWAARQHYLKNHCSHSVLHSREAGLGHRTAERQPIFGSWLYWRHRNTSISETLSKTIHSTSDFTVLYTIYSSSLKNRFASEGTCIQRGVQFSHNPNWNLANTALPQKSIFSHQDV